MDRHALGMLIFIVGSIGLAVAGASLSLCVSRKRWSACVAVFICIVVIYFATIYGYAVVHNNTIFGWQP